MIEIIDKERQQEPGTELEQKSEIEKKKSKACIPEGFVERWEERCARFKHVEWVKRKRPGVKVLKISK
ncbi:MAG: hypothetical protein HFH41_03990 [Lachnospiraceae bacterium]|nr:hypothetical protein [Lachnospiraceae bacterium]